MADVKYTMKDMDAIDLIVYKHYGEDIFRNGAAVEYLMEWNHNISRLGLFPGAGQEIILPDLPEEIKNTFKQGATQSTIDIFPNDPNEL